MAREAASELTGRLANLGIHSGMVVDLAAGTGILSRRVCESGFDALGVDVSEAMLRIARQEAVDASFVRDSLWSVDLPSCVAVAAIGEAFNYVTDSTAGPAALEQRLRAIHAALVPGGLLLFDVAGPGRSGPTGTRRGFWDDGLAPLGLVEKEDDNGQLTRTITLFVREADHYRRVDENHLLTHGC